MKRMFVLAVLVLMIGLLGSTNALAANPSDVHLIEVLADASQSGSELNYEWVEIYNDTDSAITLNEWEICDNTACDSIPAATIQPGKALVIAANKTGFETNHSCTYVNIVYLSSPIGSGLNNSADMVLIRDENDIIIDQMNWGTPNSGWANYNTNLWNPGLTASGAGNSYLRDPVSQDTDTTSDWTTRTSPSNGEPCQGPNAITLSSLTAHAAAPWAGIALAGLFLGALVLVRRKR